jgi:glycerol-3-phosphate cytidylyltransferase
MIGYLPMTADLFHVGHLRAIRQAKKKCDYLVIGLLDCPTYKKTIIPYWERKEILEALPEVDKVVRQTSLKIKYKCDVIFSGDGFDKEEMINGVKLIPLKYYKHQSTTNIKKLCSKLRFSH